jgi:hypothetical protein
MGASGPSKVEYPPLLCKGFHVHTLAGLRQRCVDGFPLSKTRAKIMAGIEQVAGRFAAVKMKGDLWIDGSFMTQKIDAQDVDVLLRVDDWFHSRCTRDQIDAIEWMKREGPALGCDAYVHVDYTQGHSQYSLGHWGYSYWLRQFGFSRSDELKGIAVLEFR